MVVLFAPDPKTVTDRSVITFVDVNGNPHKFTKPEPEQDYAKKNILDALWKNSVFGRIKNLESELKTRTKA